MAVVLVYEPSWPELQTSMGSILSETKSRKLDWADAVLPDVDDAKQNANTLFRWLTAQSEEQQENLVEALFARLLARSAKSRAASVNACTKLCGFVQHCAHAGAERHARLVAWAFGESVALRLFDFYLEWNETDQHRSMKLVLDVLALLLQTAKSPRPTAQTAALQAYVLRTLAGIVSGEIARPLAKSAIGSLHGLLGKRVFDMAAVGRAYHRSTAAVDGEAEDPDSPVPLLIYERLASDLLQAMPLTSVASVAGKLLLQLFAYLRTAAATRDTPALAAFTTAQWLSWLLASLQGRFALAEDIKTYFFLPLFKADRAGSLELLLLLNKNHAGGRLDGRAMLRIAALEAGKKRGLVTDAGLNLDAKGDLSIPLDECGLADVLARGPASMRSLAVSLLVSSPSQNRPLSPATFALLRLFLPSYHAEADAKFRLELLGYIRHMGERLHGALRAMRTHAAPWYVREALAQHEAFLSWYLDFLRDELGPTASYQRHFTALRAVLALNQITRAAGSTEATLDESLARRIVQDGTWVRCLLDLLLDPFDDVRALAMDLLQLVPPALLDEPFFPLLSSSSLRHLLRETSQRADRLASRTARADHADGAARCQALLCHGAVGLPARLTILCGILDRLEAKIAHAQRDLGAAVRAHPVHGDFAAARYVWTVLARVPAAYTDEALRGDLAPVQARLVRCSEAIWQVVRPVLCDDAPEGHLPAGLGEEHDNALDSKDLLSFSFRAVSEASSLLGTVVDGLRAVRGGSSAESCGRLVPTQPVFEAIGALVFEQLAALRHRGALTAVAHTFLACCQLASHPLVARTKDDNDNNDLVFHWYQATLRCIRNQRSTTRRSAGLPSLFAGILASHAARPSFTEAMQMVCRIAQEPARVHATDDDERLPQVHAINCLREVFRSSLLSKRAEQMLPACLQLAANSLRSDVWAIRNCGLLLLRSLIDCLFGTGESKAALEAGWDGHTLRVSYKNHPTLPGVLLDLLETAGDTPTDADSDVAAAAAAAALQIERQQAAAESVFPALDILRRAGPPEAHRAALYRAVVAHLGSHLWHVREMAARTVCAFFVLPSWSTGVAALLQSPGDAAGWTEANRLHGTLLAVRFVLGKLDETSQGPNPFSSMLPQLLRRLDDTAAQNAIVAASPEIEAAYLETRNTVCGLALKHGIVLDLGAAPPVLNPAMSSSSALWRVQHVLCRNYAALFAHGRTALEDLLLTSPVVLSDPDTAVRLLDAVQQTWFEGAAQKTPGTALWLSSLYMDVCLGVGPAPDVRATALRHLTDVLDHLLADNDDRQPPEAMRPLVPKLGRVWTALATGGAINPTLSCAILRVSGPLVAVAVLFAESDSVPGIPSVATWTAMMAEAGRDEQTLDTRMAAAEALQSFAVATADGGKQRAVVSPGSCAFAFCVYDRLLDDDDEIRAVAATAAGCLLGRALVPGEAAAQLPAWMAGMFRAEPTFLPQAVGRMIGQASAKASWSWLDTATALRAARQVDTTLFAVEEKNLFVDEEQEARRWAAVLSGLPWRGEEAAGVLGSLVAWASEGLTAILTDDTADDGPLGWTSTPDVFAVYARLLVCAQMLVRLKMENGLIVTTTSLAGQLAAFGMRACSRRVHGMLVSMATVPPRES